MFKGKALKHGRFFYYPDDMIGQILDRYGEWSETELSFLLELIGSGDVVVDVGAHIGTFTIPFARKVGASGTVIALEAQRLIYNNLVGNLFLNEMNNVRAFNMICGREEFFLNLLEVDGGRNPNSGEFSITPSARQGRRWNHVRAEPLDLTLQGLPRLDLIKIDVEGYEAEVLLGAAATLRRLRPVVHCECLGEASLTFLSRFGVELGYRLYGASFEHFNPDNHFRNPQPFTGAALRDSNVLMWPMERELPAAMHVTEIASFAELAAAPTPRWG